MGGWSLRPSARANSWEAPPAPHEGALPTSSSGKAASAAHGGQLPIEAGCCPLKRVQQSASPCGVHFPEASTKAVPTIYSGGTPRGGARVRGAPVQALGGSSGCGPYWATAARPGGSVRLSRPWADLLPPCVSGSSPPFPAWPFPLTRGRGPRRGTNRSAPRRSRQAAWRRRPTRGPPGGRLPHACPPPAAAAGCLPPWAANCEPRP